MKLRQRLAAFAAPLVLVATSATAVELFKPVALAKSAKAAPQHLVGTVAVAFDVLQLARMQPGEIATFALPNGKSYEAVLDRIDRHENGDVSWIGHVANDTVDRLVIVTMGEAGTYGTLTLPDANYGVLPGEGHEWLFDTDMSQLHIDRSADDVDLPELPAGGRAKAEPSCPVITAKPSQQATIDVLFVMAPDFVSAHGGAANANTRVNNLISSINTYYANSKIAITLRRAGAINVPYHAAAAQDQPGAPAAAGDSGALNNLISGGDAFSHVAAMRNLTGADMVAFMRGPRGGGGISGIARLGGFGLNPLQAGDMFSVSGDAPGYSGTLMAHELGHNMGNHHDAANANTATPGATSYAYGYTRCGTSPSAACPGTAGFNNPGTGGFGTIMSYWRPNIARFSNPNDTCSANGSGTVPCGGTVSSNTPVFSAQADETRSINCVRLGIEAFRAPHVAACANPALDTDRDGIPDCVEAALARNAGARDNDIFSAGATPTLLFAMQQYRDFLSREADADGAHYWARALHTGANTRTQMVDQFVGSGEFQGAIAPVARLYFAYFLRIPDYAGLQHWIGQFRAGSSLAAISQAFAGSAEFTQRYGALNNAQFVSLVYQNVLGRAPDAAGLAHWTNQLTSNAMTRGGVMAAFSESAEYGAIVGTKVYVTMMYMGMLRREPDLGGFNHWVGYRNAGNSGAALIDAFLGSAEYRGRFL